jgi:hypothetical protein
LPQVFSPSAQSSTPSTGAKGKLIGYISQISENDFIITKAKEGAKQTIAYADATEVKVKNEKRISTAGKILIVLGVLSIVSLLGNGFGG